MGLPTVFISYNPNSDIEQTLAVRLHTIGAVHGFKMLLPDRIGYSRFISNETRSRILLADYFILFSTTLLSPTVMEEMNVAFNKLHDKSKILVIYDKGIGKNLKGADNFTEINIDRSWPVEKMLDEIVTKIKSIQTKKGNTEDGGLLSFFGPILLTGVALFALSNIFDEPPRKKKPAIKKRPAKKVAKKING